MKLQYQIGLYEQVLRYVILSAISFAGNLGLTVALHEWAELSSFIAVPIAMCCITLFNFCTLKLYIFRGGKNHWAKELIGFVVSIGTFRFAEYLVFVLLHGALGAAVVPAYAAVLAISAILKFLFFRSTVFAGPRETCVLTGPAT